MFNNKFRNLTTKQLQNEHFVSTITWFPSTLLGHANWIKLGADVGLIETCPQLSVVPLPILEDILTRLLFTERVG